MVDGAEKAQSRLSPDSVSTYLLLGALAALQVRQHSSGLGIRPLCCGTRGPLLGQHLVCDTNNLASLNGVLLGLASLLCLLHRALLVDAAVLDSPLGGQVTALHLLACHGFAGDEVEQLLVHTDKLLAVAGVDTEAAVVARFGLDHHLYSMSSFE